MFLGPALPSGAHPWNIVWRAQVSQMANNQLHAVLSDEGSKVTHLELLPSAKGHQGPSQGQCLEVAHGK